MNLHRTLIAVPMLLAGVFLMNGGMIVGAGVHLDPEPALGAAIGVVGIQLCALSPFVAREATGEKALLQIARFIMLLGIVAAAGLLARVVVFWMEPTYNGDLLGSYLVAQGIITAQCIGNLFLLNRQGSNSRAIVDDSN